MMGVMCLLARQRCPSLLCRKSPTQCYAIRGNDGLQFIPTGLALGHLLGALVWVYAQGKLVL